MAQQDSGFARTVRETGVPNTVTQGIQDTATASLIGTLGGAAIEAASGAVDANLESNLEDTIESAVGAQQQQQQPQNQSSFFANFGPADPAGTVIETAPYSSEVALQTEGNSLRQAFESGQIGYAELAARMQARTRRSISMLPGRAPVFRNILGNVLGDNQDRLQPLKELDRQRQTQQSLLEKEMEKIDATARSLGIPKDVVINHARWKLLQAKDTFDRERSSAETGSGAISLFNDDVEVALRTALAETGGTTIDEDQIALLRQHAITSFNNRSAQLRETAGRDGWAQDAQGQISRLEDELDRKLNQIKEFSSADVTKRIADQMQALKDVGSTMEFTALQEINEVDPRLGMQIAALMKRERDIQEMPESKAKRQALAVFKNAKEHDTLVGFREKSRLGDVSGVKELQDRILSRIRTGTYEPINTTKDGASSDVRTPVTEPGDVESIKKSIDKLMESDEEAYSIAALSAPELRATAQENPEIMNALRDKSSQWLANLIGDYDYDARAHSLLGKLNRPSANYRVNVEGRMMSAADIDENYTQGLQQAIEFYDSYPELTGGLSGNAFVKESLEKLLLDNYARGAVTDTKTTIPEQSIIADAFDAFDRIKQAILGPGTSSTNTGPVSTPPGFSSAQPGISPTATLPPEVPAAGKRQEPLSGRVINPGTSTLPQQVTDEELASRSPGAASVLRGTGSSPAEAPKELKSTPRTTTIIDEILKNEGGFQNDPNDGGNYIDGELIGTNRGITPTTYKDALGKVPTEQDMRELTEAQARKIYDEIYIKQPKIDQLPDEIVANVADMGVNSGPSTAISILQEMIGVTPDGLIGPETIRAVKKAAKDSDLSSEYSAERIAYYSNISRGKPELKKFLKGWIKRANSFI